MKTLDDILKKLRDSWPQYNIDFKRANNRPKDVFFLVVNDKKLLEISETHVRRDLEFLREREDFEKIVLDLFNDKIIEYHKKYSKKIFNRNGSIGLSLQQVKEACKSTKSNREASRYLHISYVTWRKYAKMYVDEEDPQKRTYFETQYNRFGKGIKKHKYNIKNYKYTIKDFLEGTVGSAYPTFQYKRRLVSLGLLLDECAICGFSERRVSDNKIPLLLDYLDGNPLNKKSDNIRLLCYNCTFLHVGTRWYKRKDGSNKKLDKIREKNKIFLEENENKTT